MRRKTVTLEAQLLRRALTKGMRRMEASHCRCTLPRELISLRIGAGLPGGSVAECSELQAPARQQVFLCTICTLVSTYTMYTYCR